VRKRNFLKFFLPKFFLIISSFFVLSGPSVVLAETYTEAVNSAIAHAQDPSAWLPNSFKKGTVLDFWEI